MRLRSAVLALLLVLLASAQGLAAPAQDEPPVEAFAPVSAEESDIVIQPPGSLANASELEPATRCDPAKRRSSIVALRWKAAAGEGLEAQRVDISKFRTGFELGRYDTTRRLHPAASGVSLEAPEPLINYYWRVLTKSPGGWSASPVSRFEAPVCPWDEPPDSVDGLATGAASDRNSRREES